MKIPAIRAQLGIWAYYSATLTFEQVAQYVKKVDKELHNSDILSEMLQRTITDNYKNISNYIQQQDERFFNSLVLAVYDGDPQWSEVRLEYDDVDFYDLGILSFSGEEKIFPVDGQHRVEGIKEALARMPELKDEKISVIFIGHKTTAEGMQRARRMFSTLNRYAKPVSLRDIIVLDEDDSIAIATRELLETHEFFSDNTILDVKNKSITTRHREFTTIITLYECNKELLKLFIENIEVFSIERKILKNETRKLREYIKFRPPEESVEKFNSFCFNFWTDFVNVFTELYEYKIDNDGKKFRTSDGGNLLFRPTALLSILKASLKISKNMNISPEEALMLVNKLPMNLEHEMWKNILWNPATQTMITTKNKLVENYIIYCIDENCLSGKVIDNLLRGIQEALNISTLDATKTHIAQYKIS